MVVTVQTMLMRVASPNFARCFGLPATGGWLCLLVILLGPAATAAVRPLLDFAGHDLRGRARLELSPTTNMVWTLQASPDLRDWVSIANLHSLSGEFAPPGMAPRALGFTDPGSAGLPQRYYRAIVRARSSADDAKNVIAFPHDPFLSTALGGLDELRWVKFAILTSEPDRVWFQDSRRYLFHYDFARTRLTPFKDVTRESFDAVTLRTNQQQAVLGAVLMSVRPEVNEYGIQFVGLDPYPREQVVKWVRLVESAVLGGDRARAVYLPAYEQSAATREAAGFFAAEGITVDAVSRWVLNQAIYAPGWALGRLRYVPTAQVQAAYASGQLRPTDILLTDWAGAEVPYVAGILTLEPATPNSHVAILARSYGIPFAFVGDTAAGAQLRALDGRDIVVRTKSVFGADELRWFPLDESADARVRNEVLALKTGPPVQITPKAHYGVLSANTDTLTPADLRYFGGKAAHFGFLRRSIPSRSPPAIAFSFDLWDLFMDQTLPGGGTLRAEIDRRLGGFGYPPDVAAMAAQLAEVRRLITRDARFSVEQQEAILAALAPFDPLRKIRFRSSTNVEDSESFTGAGLYDSYSGCVADDLDADQAGPCRCDASESNERGVFRAIQRVYASFYNDNAFFERRRLGLDEATMGMALLVHHSTPDEFEMANGVATLNQESSYLEARLVTQTGAFSVANPEITAQPEVVRASKFGTSTFLTLEAHSGLLPFGAHVLKWETEYRDLTGLLSTVAAAYGKYYPSKARFALDFEYKKVQPGELRIKQVRPLPLASTSSRAPYLLHRPGIFTTRQGELGDVFSKHRLKGRWELRTRNLSLTDAHLAEGVYTNVAVELIEGAGLVRLTEGPQAWPGAVHQLNGSDTIDQWETGSGTARRSHRLITSVIRAVQAPASPVVTSDDFRVQWQATYAAPQPVVWNGQRQTVTTESVELEPAPALTPYSLRQTRSVTSNGIAVETAFYWPEPPSGPSAGYTAPLVAWEKTRISGLTPTPLVLQGYYSQTYSPGHHNFYEDFLFEPQLENGLPQEQLEALRSRNIRWILASVSFDRTWLYAVGFDGTVKRL
jgi:hypothetical protein